jgi:hypothetical protein
MPACEDKVYNNPLFFEEQGFRRQTQDIFRILKSDDDDDDDDDDDVDLYYL